MFFGQNGPGGTGAVAAAAAAASERSYHASSSASHHHVVVPVGRDVSGGETSIPSGLIAGKRSLDGSNAAFDMKSLGKHIEAVSEGSNSVAVRRLIICSRCR
jgi:dynamin 1-like protein